MRKLVLVVALLLVPAAARADRWYGWQILAADAGSVLLGVVTDQPMVAVAGLAVGAPAIHLAHGDGLQAAASAGLRLGVPLGAMVIAGATSGAGDHDGMAAAGGLVVGAAAALVVDVAFLSVHHEPTATRPMVTPVDRGAVLGISGRF